MSEPMLLVELEPAGILGLDGTQILRGLIMCAITFQMAQQVVRGIIPFLLHLLGLNLVLDLKALVLAIPFLSLLALESPFHLTVQGVLVAAFLTLAWRTY